jgi:uncharacterized protein YraI
MIGILVMLLLTAGIVAAQAADCAANIKVVYAAALQACAQLGRNQICHAGGVLDPSPREGVQVTLGKPGERASLAALASISSSGYDAQTGSLGLAVMNARFNLPDNIVRLIAVGDLRLENQSTASVDYLALAVTVADKQGANVRAEPREAAALSDVLRFGQTVPAVGRTADGAWLWVVVPGTTGWLRSELVRASADVKLLEVVKPEQTGLANLYAPMQKVTLRTDPNTAACPQVPNNGLLAQTPSLARVQIVVNGLPITFSGTIFIESPSSGELTLSALEGEAAYGEDADKPIKTGERVLFTAGGQSGVQASQPEEYAYYRARYLPFSLLPRPVKPPFALGGLLKSFAPGTDFLNKISADAPCTVAWTKDVNLRFGPGTDYPIRRGVAANTYAQPDARGQAVDGVLWWRLAEDIWLVSSSTLAAGACGNLPLVERPPLPER